MIGELFYIINKIIMKKLLVLIILIALTSCNASKPLVYNKDTSHVISTKKNISEVPKHIRYIK